MSPTLSLAMKCLLSSVKAHLYDSMNVSFNPMGGN